VTSSRRLASRFCEFEESMDAKSVPTLKRTLSKISGGE